MIRRVGAPRYVRSGLLGTEDHRAKRKELLGDATLAAIRIAFERRVPVGLTSIPR